MTFRFLEIYNKKLIFHFYWMLDARKQFFDILNCIWIVFEEEKHRFHEAHVAFAIVTSPDFQCRQMSFLWRITIYFIRFSSELNCKLMESRVWASVRKRRKRSEISVQNIKNCEMVFMQPSNVRSFLFNLKTIKASRGKMNFGRINCVEIFQNGVVSLDKQHFFV